MIAAKESLRKLLRTRMLWGAALLLLVLTRWAHVEFRSLHNLTAYQALKAGQLDGGSIDMLTSSRAPAGTALDARTLWLMGRYHLYDSEPTRASGPLSEAADVLSSDYQVHRDLLYAYGSAEVPEEFVREYERGRVIRQSLRDTIASGGGPVVYVDALSSGSFDHQNPRSREVVLVNYTRFVDARLAEGDVQSAIPKLLLLRELFNQDLLVLSRIDAACRLYWEDALCTETSLEQLRDLRWRAWEDARLTGLMADLAMQLHDQSVWTEMEVLALGRYLVWQHAGEAETAHFLDEVSARGLDGSAWWELSEELAWRNELADRMVTQPEEARAPIEGNLLADPSALLDDTQGQYVSLGQQQRQWHLWVPDDPAYGEGRGYIGGIDSHACPGGEVALRLDGLWSDPGKSGPDTGVGFASNEFTLEPGAEYELSLLFRIPQSHLISRVTVEFLPDEVFGPSRSYRMALVEGHWTFRQELAVGNQRAVSGNVRVRYLGYGPLWLCEPQLVCENCDQPAETVQPLSDEYQVHLSDSSLRCEECVITDYQVHRDLLYAYDRAGEPERFVQEYEKGQGTRQLLQNILGAAFQMDQLLQSAGAFGGGLPVRADVLSEGGFDLQNPGSREMVLVNYILLIDASLEQGYVQGVGARLAFLEDVFSADFLVLPRLYQLCQLEWDDGLCSEVLPVTLRRFRLGAWEDARLTDLFANTALWLYDEGLWTEMELLSLGRYLVWQHAGEVETTDFLGEVSGRGLSDGVWSELAEELARRRDPAACIAAPGPAEGNLLADASQWRLDIRDVAPYGGASYVGGTDDCACPNGERALRIDGLWQGPHSGGPTAWAGFESNEFTLQSGAEYELGLAFRVADPRAVLYVEFLPDGLFEPEKSQRLSPVADKWLVMRQGLTVGGPKDVSARLKVRYLGYGPLWLCEPRLLSKECDEPAEAFQPSSGGYQVHLSEPVLMCKDCTNS